MAWFLYDNGLRHERVNRTFWDTILPHFTQKMSKDKKINLIEKGNLISSDEEIYSILTIFCLLCLI